MELFRLEKPPKTTESDLYPSPLSHVPKCHIHTLFELSQG